MMSWAHDGASVASAVFGTWLSGLVGLASASSGGGGTDEPRTTSDGPHQGDASPLLAHASEGALSVAMVPPRARGRGSRSVAEPCSAAAMVPQVASSDGAAAWSSGGVRGGPARRARASSLAVDSQPRADDAARAALDDGETSSSGEPPSGAKAGDPESPPLGPLGARGGQRPQDELRIPQPPFDSGAPGPGGRVAAFSVGTLPNRIFVPSAWRQKRIFVP